MRRLRHPALLTLADRDRSAAKRERPRVGSHAQRAVEELADYGCISREWLLLERSSSAGLDESDDKGGMVSHNEDPILAPKVGTLSPSARFEGGPGVTACEFWQWGFSDLRLNMVRGVLAEFLVAKAVGDPANTLRDPWANYDVETPDGVTIEVKSSAYLQAWTMRRLTKPTFAGLTGRSWAPLTGTSKKERSGLMSSSSVFRRPRHIANMTPWISVNGTSGSSTRPRSENVPPGALA